MTNSYRFDSYGRKFVSFMRSLYVPPVQMLGKPSSLFIELDKTDTQAVTQD